MRPIDADELIKAIMNDKSLLDTYGTADRWEETIAKINSMPTVEQKYGHWIVCTDFGDGCLEIKCSECGEAGFWRNRPLYCPDCGAKMVENTELEKPIESDQMTFTTFVTCAICMWSRDVGCGTYSCTNDKVKDKVHKGDYNCPEAKLKREP
jgi:hypothetical protein